MINKEINRYLNRKLKTSNNQDKEKNVVKNYFKLPYIGKYSKEIKNKIAKLCLKYCKEINIEICFSLLKTGSFFIVKDCISSECKSFVVYLFSCPSCRASYVGETTRRLAIRIEEHLSSGKGSVIFEHISQNENCKIACKNQENFKIIDKANSEFQLKIKEAIHITLIKPALNKQIKHERLNIIV